MQIPIIIDVEASGFGSNSYPIEIGLAMDDGSSHCFLLQPPEHWRHWDREAEKLHGLTRNQLLTFGKPLQKVAMALNELLGCRTVYSDAWGNDQSWIALLFDEVGMLPSFRLDHILSIMDEPQLAHWEQTRAGVIAEMELRRHRASSDARIIQHTYLRTREVTRGKRVNKSVA